MLNHAARYFPILKALTPYLQPGASILEVGSGPTGIGRFHQTRFVGCDLSFERSPRGSMIPVRASALDLPFADGAFDVVIASDVLEHVPPEARKPVIREMLRVTRIASVFGYPCGPNAFEVDRQLFLKYQRKRLRIPQWLQEHMDYPMPDEHLFEDIDGDWIASSAGNESTRFHLWMMSKEMSRIWDYSFRALLLAAPGAVRALLRRADAAPFYRRLVLLTKRTG